MRIIIMRKLSKKQANAIANLIAGVMTWQRMANESAVNGNPENFTRYYINHCKDVVRLADEHGIELPGLDYARDTVHIANSLTKIN